MTKKLGIAQGFCKVLYVNAEISWWCEDIWYHKFFWYCLCTCLMFETGCIKVNKCLNDIVHVAGTFSQKLNKLYFFLLFCYLFFTQTPYCVKNLVEWYMLYAGTLKSSLSQ